MEEINFMRHGHKMAIGEERLPLNESGLSEEQQEIWADAVQRLHLEKPEITYDTLPKIEKMAEKICQELPERALVIFNSTDTPRTKMTADLLSTYVYKEGQKQNKEIGTAFIWDPADVAAEPASLTNTATSLGSDKLLQMMREAEKENGRSPEEGLPGYFEGGGSMRHNDEDRLVMLAANKDLASPDSAFKKRAEAMKIQVAELSEVFSKEDRPVYFYGIGHHGSVIAADVAFNGRQHYDDVTEIPQPMNPLKITLKNEI